jgi:hypothetical protein
MPVAFHNGLIMAKWLFETGHAAAEFRARRGGAQLEYLEARAARGSREAYYRVLANVPAIAPLPGDERIQRG